MKGKGKGKEQPDTKDCPLQFPDLTPIDHAAACPKYNEILEQADEKLVKIGDLDELHIELQELLMCSTKRRDQLEEEMKNLIQWMDKKNKPSPKMEVESSGKKSRNNDAKTNKKSKESNTKVHQPSPSGRAKSKNNQNRAQDHDQQETVVPPQYTRTDAPNRFWESLRPYYCDITQEHIKFLEAWAKPNEESDFEIPALGKHYSYDWSTNCVQDEQKEGAKANDKRKGTSSSCSSSFSSGDAERVLKKARKDYVPEECPYGPLTQRLVSCLIDEDIMTPLNETLDNAKDGAKSETDHVNGEFIKSLNIGNAAELEKQIRVNLVIAGILDADEIEDIEEEDPEDQILVELKSVQSRLKAVSSYNLELKKKLLKRAREEIVRQDHQKKLHRVDAEIMNLQSKYMVSKRKKGSLTKKEEDHIAKLIKQREELLKLSEPTEAPSSST